MTSIGVVFYCLLLGWILAANGIAMGAIFSPLQEQVRRETFEQSKAYNDGMVQEIRAMQFEYIKADADHKIALASVIKHRIAGYPENNFPSDISSFIRSLP
ncbi:hypothetical protein UFOVP602_19 [uncultured Caudovirales phage]|uniref:Uncharacterized protein n=1 Tax=uncultured Caudovirales phage TaxID=2100421 RepID=A0A6J5N0M8_9CAUD|nr:hypothetical protein UFOVP602_19 [uncultured Caudovirales phage]